MVEHYGDRDADYNIRLAVLKHAPDVVATCGILHPARPSINTLAWIRTRCRSVFICWDAGSPDWQPVLRQYHDQHVFDLMVAAEGSYFACVDVAFPEPKNPDLWRPFQEDRNDRRRGPKSFRPHL